MTDGAERNRARRRFTVDALFTDTRPQASGVTDLENAKLIELSRIEADPDQPRRTFDEERLEELVSSITQDGVLQPIVVRYDAAHDIYVIVHGERRWRASTRAGLTAIPALVRDVPAERRLIQQLVENVVRDDLNAVDRAAALRALRDQLGNAPWEHVAEAVGIKRSRLFQLLGTEKLSPQAKDDIQQGRLSEKQSRALQGLDAPRQEALRDLIVERGLSAVVANRLAKVFKTYPLPDANDPAAVRSTLENLYDLVDPQGDDAVRAQTHTVLDAVRTGSADDLADLLATPAFDAHRVTKEIGALSRSLTRTSRSLVRKDPALRETLLKLRDGLDELLG